MRGLGSPACARVPVGDETDPAAGTLLTSYARVHQGAHWPGDVAAGAALGVTVGAALASRVDP